MHHTEQSSPAPHHPAPSWTEKLQKPERQGLRIIVRPEDTLERGIDNAKLRGIDAIGVAVEKHEHFAADSMMLPHAKETYTGVIVSSPAAAKAVAELNMEHLPIYAVGEGTQKALVKAGVDKENIIVPTKTQLLANNDSPMLATLSQLKSVQEDAAAKDPKLLYLSGERVRGTTEKALEQPPFDTMIDRLPVYRMQKIENLPDAAKEALNTHKVQDIQFTSEGGIEQFFALAKQEDMLPSLQNVSMVTISETLKKKLENTLKECDVQPKNIAVEVRDEQEKARSL